MSLGLSFDNFLSFDLNKKIGILCKRVYCREIHNISISKLNKKDVHCLLKICTYILVTASRFSSSLCKK